MNVDYPKVIDALADAIKELNCGNVAHTYRPTGDAVDATDAAADHSASGSTSAKATKKEAQLSANRAGHNQYVEDVEAAPARLRYIDVKERNAATPRAEERAVSARENELHLSKPRGVITRQF